jgi:CMP-N-acetylneuraminic acid synthetase/nucleoside-diphosphate-sugar epimerase
MIEQLSVLAVIPARGGSKGIPRKNIHPLAGKPLIAWTAQAAAAARYIDRVILSSEDDAIIETARSLGVDVPFVRPVELARDDTPGVDPVIHAVRTVPGYDLVVLLQPTSPLRTADDIDAAIELLVSSGAMCCVSVTEATNHPYWTYKTDTGGRLAPFIEVPPGTATRRQDLPKALAINGALYVARIPWFLEHRTFLAADTIGLEMPAERSIDIDSSADLHTAEQLLLERDRVLVTGATGFVGPTLCGLLAEAGYAVRAAVRRPDDIVTAASEHVCVGDIGPSTDWTAALQGVSAVVHAAGRAHVLNEAPSNSDPYITTNTEGTACLANAAARAGAVRFIFVSSIKVNGEETRDRPYTATDTPRPEDPYGRSKWLAEQSLAAIAAQTGIETVIVRPPLVYGPGVKANFLRLLRWVDRSVPLPLGAVNNRRSLVSVWNLCDLLVNVVANRAAAGMTFLVSDADDLSTPELIRRIAAEMRRPARLLPVPSGVLRLVGAITGYGREVNRLCGSLAVDPTATRAVLGWSPVLTVDEGLSRTVSWYLSRGGI